MKKHLCLATNTIGVVLLQHKDVQTGKTEKINYTHIFPNVLLECERLYDTVSKINEQVAKLTGEQQ